MTVDEVLKYFGSGAAVGRELGLCRTTFNAWRMRGYIPRLQQYRIERVTEGKLKIDAGIRK
ncbi:TPA: Cro/Cl family transcriptional regulator [Legionella pneumophila]|nr:Cro/CI family transcriptional regulator [Legionella pneumophila subsp. fraseri]HAT1796290.1 Cro/Cl family transcriptional regulator [Legionella pneumophila]MDW8961432.1 Cro/CI family transcriptional regulator [Legionella pneumophila subsp. fraseri]MDW9036291.1 Cro/CI family transcriptional regulator [Legionella pneumophila subsp. fraseri]MDW9038952.1 Cro/CI family transcriptional regulator [Legionella pneumophila subsp. fraseri]